MLVVIGELFIAASTYSIVALGFGVLGGVCFKVYRAFCGIVES